MVNGGQRRVTEGGVGWQADRLVGAEWGRLHALEVGSLRGSADPLSYRL